jgi:hypothetical protein
VTPNPPGTPPVLLTPTATPAASTGTTTVEGSITVSIDGQPYTLTGTLGNALIVEYHKDFDQAISLGPVDTIAPRIADAFNFPDLATEITNALNSLNTLPVAGQAISAVLSASVRITDLEINTQSSTYGVGLALDFTTSSPQPSLFGITLISLGFKVTRVNAAATPAT